MACRTIRHVPDPNRDQVDLDACARGDSRAFADFVSAYGGLVWAGVRRVLRGQPEQDIEDAAQDVFVRLLKDDGRLLRSFDPNRASMSTWLTLVSRSTAIDRARKLGRTVGRATELNDRTLEAPEAPLESGDLQDSAIPLGVLTDRQRLVLHLLYQDEQPVDVVAQLLQVSEQTVRSTKHKALERLRAAMHESQKPGDDPSPSDVQRSVDHG